MQLFKDFFALIDSSHSANSLFFMLIGSTIPYLFKKVMHIIFKNKKEGIKIRVSIYNVIQGPINFSKDELIKSIKECDELIASLQESNYEVGDDIFKQIMIYAEENKRNYQAHLEADGGNALLKSRLKTKIIPIENERKYKIKSISFYYDTKSNLDKFLEFIKYKERTEGIKFLPADFESNVINKTTSTIDPIEFYYDFDENFEDIYLSKDLCGISCRDTTDKEWWVSKNDISLLKNR